MTETIYFVIAVAPAPPLVLMLLLGIGEWDFDFGDGDADSGFFGGPSPIGLKLLCAFISGFGLGGLIDMTYDWPMPDFVWGLIFAFALYFVVYAMMFILHVQSSNTQTDESSLIGMKGVLTGAISESGAGEIQLKDPKTGNDVILIARSLKEGQTFSKGARVSISSIAVGVAYVEV